MTNFETLCNEYRENRRMIEELEAMQDDLKARLLALMGDRDTVIEGSSKATRKQVTTTRFNSTGLKADHPDLYSQYSTRSTYTRFTVI